MGGSDDACTDTYYDSSLEHRKGKAKMYDQRGRWRCGCLSDFRAVLLGDYFLYSMGGVVGFCTWLFPFFFIVRKAVLLRSVVL